MDKRLIGKLGEKLACKRYTDKKYRLIGLNYRTRMGEVDVIAQKGNTVVFAEVKTRKDAKFATAKEAVDYRKQQRIKAAAARFIAENGLDDFIIRFDVVEVYHPENNREINIIENAFY